MGQQLTENTPVRFDPLKPSSWTDRDLSAMARLAEGVAAQCRAGMAFGLSGGLGAGKTTFVQLLGTALGVRDVISSPTYTYMHTYQGRDFPVLHADLYRADPVDRIVPELLDIITAQTHLVLIEWPERWHNHSAYLSGLFRFSCTTDDKRSVYYSLGP